MVGFYGFGARTGGTPIIYESLFVLIGASGLMLSRATTRSIEALFGLR
jgi:hypothetical protein